MNWRPEAINDLRLYGQRKRFLENVDNQMTYLNNDFTMLKGCVTDSESVDGGTSRSEDHLINNIMRRDKLSTNKRLSIEFVNVVESSLTALSPQHRDILYEFYIERSRGHVERLMDKYHVEQTQVYRLKDEALYNFIILMYGIADF